MPYTFRGTETVHIEAPADAVFAVITDIDRLPEWNGAIDHVVERPPVLAPGAEWVIEMHAMGSRWDSRSWVTEIDPAARRFEHRTQSDDGNPSYALWTWQVIPAGGSEVTVTWEVHPLTFWRRTLLARIRRGFLAKEVRASLAALVAACTVVK
jgi:uncharacterized protein YndB with AHSA1/START domain